jgi:hypothetical protein
VAVAAVVATATAAGAIAGGGDASASSTLMKSANDNTGPHARKKCGVLPLYPYERPMGGSGSSTL